MLALQILLAQMLLVIIPVLHRRFQRIDVVASSRVLIPDLFHVFSVIDFENITGWKIVWLPRTLRLFRFSFILVHGLAAEHVAIFCSSRRLLPGAKVVKPDTVGNHLQLRLHNIQLYRL